MIRPGERERPHSNNAWLRALQLTAPISRDPGRVFPVVIAELAERFGDAPAVLSDRERLTYRALADRSNRYARWALDQGIAKGDVVCLLMPNRPEYLAVWLGITRVGGVVSLLNTSLVGQSLAHCINIVSPRHIIASAELIEPLTTARPDLAGSAKIWAHGSGDDFPSVDRDVERHPGDSLGQGERRPVGLEDRALLIYTSGTTGLPKAAHVSHFRLMQWSHWFAGMMDTASNDRMYNCLPMFHSVGGVVATGAALVGGGSVVIREKFSASQFWNDVIRWDCTLFQYIGELCRYLLHAERHPDETTHRLRMGCGNGLRADVWPDFKRRFRIPRILEFYAATEGNVSLFNVDGKPGAIGRIPSFLAHRSPMTLVRLDASEQKLIRDEQGYGVRCASGEVGEAIGRVLDGPAAFRSRFEGYTSEEASENRIVRNVFEPGDAWYRTGDLMRKDDEGYFYFVDRIGDTFRWKGQNVATSEVAEAICAFPGVEEANVYGVTVPGADGRAGMAALVARSPLDLAALRAHLAAHLPDYARPRFLRLRREMDLTATFKHTKRDLVRQGYDPDATDDALYFDDGKRDAFVRLDKPLYDRIQTGQVCL
jgi:fatty-acyl-CoA synthase